MAYNGTNPVSVGDKTLKSHYDRVFDNTVANNTRLDAMDLTAQRLWLLGVVASLSDNTITTTDDFTCVHCQGTEAMICDWTQSRYSSTYGKSFAAAVAVGGFTTIRDVVSNSDGSQWVVVGDPSGTNGIAYSSDNGTSWTGVSSSSVDLSGVCYSGTTYVCVGDTGVIYSSTNGTAWTARTADGTPANITFSDVCWSPTLSLFIAVGVDTTGGSHTEIQTSPTGTTWTARTAATSSQALAVAEVDFGSSTYIVCTGLSGEIQYSSNATAWSLHTQSGVISAALSSIIALPTGALVADGQTKVAQILSTSQLAEFKAIPSGSVDTNSAMSYSAECGVMIVGDNGAISKSYPYSITSL